MRDKKEVATLRCRGLLIRRSRRVQRPVSPQRDRRREFDRTFLRTSANTVSPEPPHISVATASMEAEYFSITLRLASACAFFPPPASFISRSPMTCCDSRESIVASYQNLNIASVPQVKA